MSIPDAHPASQPVDDVPAAVRDAAAEGGDGGVRGAPAAPPGPQQAAIQHAQPRGGQLERERELLLQHGKR